ncbi:MAG TPA: glycosyltransferase [Terriglobia bacterium]|nr:glycosyltransferase [Terriglobia bacterium]
MAEVRHQSSEMVRLGSRRTGYPLLQVWRSVELSRETAWDMPSRWRAARLRRRAFLAARSLPVIPGRQVLELGAGSGKWTEHLALVFGGQNLITAAVFNKELEYLARSKNLPTTAFVYIEDIRSAFARESFDYILGTDISMSELGSATLEVVSGWLKPGGKFLFFVPNSSNPLARLRKTVNRACRADRAVGIRKNISPQVWTDEARSTGFSDIEVTACEVVPPLHSSAGQAIGLILERAPIARRLANTVCLCGGKPGNATDDEDLPVSMATHPQLFGAVSVVVPCHNEEANIERLVKTLLGLYGDYIKEIVIVDDNSADRTAGVAAALASTEPRVTLVMRKPPSGVGRALRDGYAAAVGKYILTIDCDFVNIAPEFKGLFDAVAAGCDGAIGSRFSAESALVRYPFFKIVCNRGYHLLLNLLLRRRVRDVSNNLKLYRAEILKGLNIEENHFAANVETGLKPLLLGYRIQEVSISWINRTAEMGNSSFNLRKVGPDYLRLLLRTAWRNWRGEYRSSC